MNATVNVELQNACEYASVPSKDEIRGWIEDAVQYSGKVGAEACSIVVRIVDEREGRTLNYRFRQSDRPTNVLAFPADDSATMPAAPIESPMGSLIGSANESARTLGDLALCGPVLEREAREQGKNPADHWGHLLIHGTLHLLGFDHQSGDEAERMERLETEILAARGIDDPYTAR